METMIAFAVMAAVLAVLLPGTTTLLQRTADDADRTLALDYAASRMARLGISEPIIVGASQENYRDWTVAINVIPNAVLPDIAAVDIVVTVSNASGASLARLTTIRLNP
ncbi:hypothetical protein [Jannaschia pohangensis]|nr:hypothetical protein [Jannaschia pohangensis]